MERLPRKQLLRIGGWYFFVNTLLAIAVASRYFKHLPAVEGVPALLYFVALTVSHFAALVVVPGFILFAPVALLVPRLALLRIWGAGIMTALLGALALDTFVYDLYRYHLNRFTFELLFGGAGSQIFQFHFTEYLLVSAVLVVGFIGELFLFRFVERLVAGRVVRRGGWVVGSIALALVACHVTHAWAWAACYRPITKVSRCYPLYLPTTSNLFFYKMGWASPDENQIALQETPAEGAQLLRYPRTTIVADSASSLNVLVILVDSWSPRVMDSTVMPRVSRFVRESMYFRNHYSGANGTRTGVFSLFYGLPGTYWYDMLAAKVRPVLIDQFLRCGYQMGIFTSASLVSPPFDHTVFAGVPGVNLHVPSAPAHVRDMQITNEWLAFIAGRDSASATPPFFGFVFYDALHAMTHPADFTGPFQPAWKYAHYEMLSADLDTTEFVNLYKNVAYFEDSLINCLLDDLRRRDLLDKTVVILTGDHGQEFNDNRKGYWGHGGNYSRAQLGTPLVIHWPGMAPATYDHWTCHYDIAPLLMEHLFHCQNPMSDFCIGRNIFDTTARDWLLVGSDDDFGIIEADRITSVHYDRSFDITDRNLNELADATLNTALIEDVLRATNAFYRGK